MYTYVSPFFGAAFSYIVGNMSYNIIDFSDPYVIMT